MSLCCFFDFTDASKITEVNGWITQINSQNDGNIVFLVSSNTAFKIGDFGPAGRSVFSEAPWHWIGDASGGTAAPGDGNHDSFLGMLFMRTGTTTRRVFDDDAFYRDLFCSNTGSISMAGHTYNISLSQNVPYLLTIEKIGVDYTISAEQLTTPFTIQTDDFSDQDYNQSNNSTHKITFGDAQYGNQGFEWGSFAILQGTSDKQKVIDFLKAQYTGVGQPQDADSPLTCYFSSKLIAQHLKDKHIVEEKELSNRICMLQYDRKLHGNPVYRNMNVPISLICNEFKLEDINFFFEDRYGIVTPASFDVQFKLS